MLFHCIAVMKEAFISKHFRHFSNTVQKRDSENSRKKYFAFPIPFWEGKNIESNEISMNVQGKEKKKKRKKIKVATRRSTTKIFLFIYSHSHLVLYV